MRLPLALLLSLLTTPSFAQVFVTIDLQPSGARAPLNVIGANCQPGQYLAPVQLTWTPGPACRVEPVLPYAAGPGTRLTFVSWDDQSASSSISIPVPAANLTRFVRLGYEHQVTTEAQPSNAASVTAGGWFASGAKATVRATANPNFFFLGWQPSSGCATIAYPEPLAVECQVDRPVIMAAVFRVTTALLPRPYTVTPLPGVSAFAGGSLTSGGTIAALAYELGGRAAYLWQPERPNSAMGQMAGIPALFRTTTAGVVRINDLGRLAYSFAPQYKMAIWTPSAPGSVAGTESPIQDPSNLNIGYPAAFNRFGQIATTLTNTNGSGLWTPAGAGGSSGTTLNDSRLSGAQGMNDFGQVLSEAAGSGYPPPLGFVVFTPGAANSAVGTFTTVTPPGATSTRTRAINSRGSVAGTYCTTPTGAACQSRAFLWQPPSPNGATGTTIDIAPPPGFSGVSSVAAMNAAGDMAGSLQVNSYQTTAFLRTAGVFYDLNLIPGVPINAEVLGLNDTGQILVTNGTPLGLLLLTPQPVPPPPAPNAVPVTITASPLGIGFAVTGVGCQPGEYNAPSTLQWTPGVACQVRWLDSQFTGPQQRRVFAGWADGQTANPRTYTGPASAATYTARFRDEVYVTTVAEPPQGGSTTGSGWFPVDSTVTITATPAPGYRFGYWLNLTYLDGATTQVTVDSQHNYFKAFFAVATPLPYQYTVTAISGMGTDDARLNNRGQVVSSGSGAAPKITLWTPTQPNATSGSVTTLTGFGIEGLTGGTGLAFNDRGQIATIRTDMPLKLWSPSTPNGTQGMVSVVNLPPNVSSFGLTKMNAYGQIYGTFSAGVGFWTPTSANGAIGSLTILPNQISPVFGANDRGQAVMEDRTFRNSVVLFTPATPNAVAGTFTNVSLPYLPLYYSNAHAMNARGAAVLTAIVTGAGESAAWLPLLWTPNSDNGSTGTSQLLPLANGFNGATPRFLNSRNEVAGSATAPNRNNPVPFLFTQGKFFAIEGVPGVSGGGYLHGLNDAGQLLLSSSLDGVLYLLTPQAGTGACPVTTSRLQETVGPTGGRVTISIAAAATCSWSAATTDTWLSINGSATGLGNGTLLVDVSGNTTGAERTSLVTINGTSFTIRQALLPTVSLYPSSLRIVVGAKGATGPQEVQIRVSGAGAVTAAMYNIYPPELTATLAQTSLPGSVTVTYNKGSAVPVSGVYSVTVGLTGADQPSITLPVTLEVQPTGVSSKPPFGSFDTPANNAASLSGGVAVTGWALDDIGVEKVEIWRDRVGGEPVFPNGKVYIGDALFVADARPDVEAQFRTLPQSRRAGWGYMLLTNVLPNPNGPPGNGVYIFEAIATDREGNIASLGRKTISVNNAASRKPFGALDTPAPGATISGTSYLSSGWALTPKPSAIPQDGRTIRLFIDGAPQGGVNYSQPRGDVAFFFPNYNNSNGPGGSKLIDSTKLSNGMHTIAWVVVDDQGNEDGMGSRYFNTLNAGATGASEPTSPLTEAVAVSDGDRLEGDPLGRVEFQLPASGTDTEWEGALLSGDDKRPLPVGSTLNSRHGRFYWHPPPGFHGDYVLEFTNRATGETHRVTVRVGPTESDRERR